MSQGRGIGGGLASLGKEEEGRNRGIVRGSAGLRNWRGKREDEIGRERETR